MRNSRLSTILAARDYNELKDVIRAAKDEESTQVEPCSSSDSIFTSQHRGKDRFYYSNRAQTTFLRGRRFNNYTGQRHASHSQGPTRQYNRGSIWGTGSRGRGRNFGPGNRSNYNHNSHNAYVLSHRENRVDNTSQSQPLQFFRE